MTLNMIGLFLSIVSPLFGEYGYIASVAYSVLVLVVGFWSEKENKPSWQTVYNFLPKAFKCMIDKTNKKL